MPDTLKSQLAALIPLDDGVHQALVDVDDYEWLSRFRWRPLSPTAVGGPYAVTWMTGEGDVQMHRLILGLRRYDQRQADHRNRCHLDNRRCNLRIASRAQNTVNAVRRHDAESPHSSRYRGVARTKDLSRWMARVGVGGRVRKHLGSFVDEVDAALAYDLAALEHWGEFANPNFLRCHHA